MVPLRSRGKFEIGGLRLAKYAPYYGEYLGVEVRSGRAHIGSDYEADFNGTTPQMKLSDGEVRLEGIEVGKPGVEAPVLSVDALAVAGIGWDWQKQELQSEAVEWTGGTVVVTRDGQGIDWQTMWRGAEIEDADEDTSTGMAIKVAKTIVAGVAVKWRDMTLREPMELNVTDFRQETQSFQLGYADGPMPLGLVAKVGSGGAVRLEGEGGLEPFEPSLAVGVEAFDLAAVGPYLHDVAGLRIRESDLSVTGHLGTIDGALMWRGDLEAAGMTITDGNADEASSWENLQITGLNWTSEPMTGSVESIRWIRPDIKWVMEADGRLNCTNGWREGEQAGQRRPGWMLRARLRCGG